MSLFNYFSICETYCTLSPSHPQMPVQRIYRGLLLAFRQVSIDFQRDLYIAVTEEFLCRLHIHLGIVERTGHRVPELVGRKRLKNLNFRSATAGIPPTGFEVEIVEVAVSSHVVGRMRHYLSFYRRADIVRLSPILCLLKQRDDFLRNWNCTNARLGLRSFDRHAVVVESHGLVHRQPLSL